MEESNAYGQAFGERLRAQTTSFVRTLRNTNIAATEVHADTPPHDLSDSHIRDDALPVAVMRRDYPVHEYFEDGQLARLSSLRTGETVLYSMKRNPQFVINNPFHGVHFYFLRNAPNRIAEDAGERSSSRPMSTSNGHEAAQAT